MVKVDYTRDYYADLELPQNCSTEEIKKQFHKLALLYHPDRNPGHEAEYNARFQLISNANEVLGDPDQRQRYDANRRRGNVNNAFAKPPPPQRSNPYRATSNFPPPPRRPNAGRPPESPPAAKRGGGAAMYTQWAGGRPPPPPRERPTSGTQDAKDRANAFNAWQHMNNAQNKHQHQEKRRPVPPPPEAPMPPRPSSHPRPPGSTSPPKSAFETMNPPHSGPFRADGHRMPRKPGFDNPTSPGEDGNVHAGSTMYTAGPRYPAAPPPAPTPPPPPPRGTAPTARRAEPELHTRNSFQQETPFAEASPKVKTPYPSSAGEKTYFSREPLSRSNSFRDSSKLNPNQDPRRQRRRSSSPPSEKKGAHEPGHDKARPVSAANPPFQASYSSEGSDDETDEEMSPPKSKPSAPRAVSGPNNHAGTNGRPANHRGPYSSYTFPLQTDTFTRTSNANFSGVNVSPTERSAPTTGFHRAESHPNMSAFRAQAQEEASAGIPPPPASAGTTFPVDQWTKSVQEENWASRWTEPQGNQTSPTKGGQSAKKARGPGPRTATRTNTNTNTPLTPQPASVEEEESGDPSMFTGAQRADTPDSNAMDIDEDIPSAPPMDRHPSIVVEGASDGPSKPQVSFQDPATSGDNLQQPPNSMNERRSSLPENFYSQSNSSQPNASQPQEQSSRLSSQLSMDDFRHVYPFKDSSSAGLGDMRDLSSQLPFTSQPSSEPAFENEEIFAVWSKERPMLPKAPLPPQKLTHDSWAFYLQKMYVYLDKWNSFNSDMIGHFEESAKAFKAFEVNSMGTRRPINEGGTGVSHDWLATSGETKDLKGWNTYTNMLKLEDKWRVHWRIGCERHADTIEQHERLRDKARRNELRA